MHPGFTSSYASHYYFPGEPGKTRKELPEDLDRSGIPHKQVILCVKISQHPYTDVNQCDTTAPRQWSESQKNRVPNVMDKGYDAERLHRADSGRDRCGFGDPGSELEKEGSDRGFYRQEMYTDFDQERYRRTKTKSKQPFQSSKRRFGEELKARKYWYQVKEIQEQGDSP